MYIIVETLSNTKQVELLGKQEFAAIAFDWNDKTFVIYVIFIANLDSVYFSCRAQIVSLKFDKTPIVFLSEYIDFANVFFLVIVIELLKHTEINDHTIELINSK